MIENYISQAFLEDRPNGDITTQSLGTDEKFGIAQLIAKQDLVLSGCEMFEKSLHHLDPELKLTWYFKDGDSVLDRQSVCQIEGNLVQLIQAERVALNFLGYLSGIATATSQYVKACEGTQTKILDTRKTLPLYRSLAKKAVVDGGGENHRMSLSDAAMIKENHINIAGSLKESVERVRNSTDKFIEVEVKDLDELKEAVQYDIQRVMLDNMSTELMIECLTHVPEKIETEASGNMTLERIPEVAKIGVDFISVGALTHSVKNADLSLLFDWNI